MKKLIGSSLLLVSLLLVSVPASAYTTATFYGTGFSDNIRVGRGTLFYWWEYLACINSSWYSGGPVSNYETDYVYVYAGTGHDYVYVQQGGWSFVNCGGDGKYLYPLNQAVGDYPQPCPYVILHGEDGNDGIAGGECTEVIYGDDGNDTLWGGGGYDWLFGGCDSDCLSDADAGYYSCGECDGDSDKENTPDSPSAGNCESSCAFCVYSP